MHLFGYKMKKAKWKKGKKVITGRWKYNPWSGKFFISLNSIDRITGENREFTVFNDKPEWYGWKLIENGMD